jgi:LPS-assembly lipoprotein
MSWSDRRQFLSALSSLAVLPACGFSPVLAPTGGAGALRGRVALDAPQNALDFAFVERMEDRIGRPGAQADLRLSYVIETGIRPVGVNPEGVATRVQIAGSVRFELTGPQGQVRVADTLRAFTAWSTTGDSVATEVASEDARQRLMAMLADAVVARLYAAGAAEARAAGRT